jgi:2-hydroxy-3-oxopropionate reductase
MPDPTPITQDSRIGFIGLGWMGANFARRLGQAGWRLLVYDIVPEKRLALAELGAEAANSAGQVAQECEVVITSLPNSDTFERLAAESLLPQARPGQVLVDLGTTRLDVTRQLAAALAEKGSALLDAPVSGDPRYPLYIFVGGDIAAFQRVQPLLQVWADPQRLTYGGGSGAGQILKGVNQLCMGLVKAAWLEAISYGTRQGLLPQLIAQALGGDQGWRLELRENAQQIAEGKAELQDLKFAELPYFLQAAQLTELELPLTRALFEFCDPGPRNWQDNMRRPYVSFWHMLHQPHKGEAVS